MMSTSFERKPTPGAADIRAAVSSAMAEREQLDHARRAEWEVDREQAWEARLRRAKLVATFAAAIATVLGVAWTVLVWYGDTRQRGATRDAWEQSVDERAVQHRQALEGHTSQSEEVHGEIRRTVRDLGALQLEQATDQRRLLLRTLDPADRRRYERKSPELRSAEAKVRRGG
jgi:hypothetical protein